MYSFRNGGSSMSEQNAVKNDLSMAQEISALRSRVAILLPQELKGAVMWKIRLNNLFGGYGDHVAVLSVLLVAFSMPIAMEFDRIQYSVIGILLGIIIPCAITLIYLYFTPSVRNKVRSAAEPEWRHLKPSEYDEVLRQKVKKSPAMKYLLFAQIPIIILGLILSRDHGPVSFLIFESVAVSVAGTHFIVTALSAAKWINLDGSAEVLEIETEDSYFVKSFSRTGSKGQYYFVFYLPSGKYVVSQDQLYFGTTVKIVRWAGTYIFLRI